jgi:N-acetyl-anhydromuramyl-L-alanine amidase AmpD
MPPIGGDKQKTARGEKFPWRTLSIASVTAFYDITTAVFIDIKSEI